jgi:hypothetical protein
MAHVRTLLGKAALVLGGLLLSLALLELGLRATRSSGGAGGAEAIAQPKPGAAALLNRVHPFLGWSRAPGAPSPVLSWPGDIPIGAPPGADLGPWTRANAKANGYGYFSSVRDYRAVPPDRFVVGIFGGSVADQLSVLAGDTLRDALSESLALAPESVVVLNLGSGAYKQPQQLISLVQLLVLDVDLDLVVNVDGFNEVVFGPRDARSGDHPLFPSRGHWAATVELARALPSDEQLERAGHIAGLRLRARAIAALAARGHLLHHSEFAKAATGAIARHYHERARALEQELQDRAAGPAASPTATLPAPCLERRDGCWGLVADLWERSSWLMQQLAVRAGATYLHVLQPAIHVADGKPLSEEELRSRPRRSRERRMVRAGYPLLRKRGEALSRRGVAFRDLSRVFAEHPETLYIDGCCHFNQRGNRILAEAIGAFAAEQLELRASGGDR